MSYAVKELFYTLQGEGAQTGRAAVFCRFAGCNLWTGREADRTRAECRFCDTDFIGTDGEGGGKFATADALADAIDACWRAASPNVPASSWAAGTPYVVFTGGEPLLQLDASLLDSVKARGFETAVETNGTLPAPPGLDWICVSPKTAPFPAGSLVQTRGDELKLVYPQAHLAPELFETLDFRHFWIQPMDGSAEGAASAEPALTPTQEAVRYCQSHPRWRLSLQTHKLIGIP